MQKEIREVYIGVVNSCFRYEVLSERYGRRSKNRGKYMMLTHVAG